MSKKIRISITIKNINNENKQILLDRFPTLKILDNNLECCGILIGEIDTVDFGSLSNDPIISFIDTEMTNSSLQDFNVHRMIDYSGLSRDFNYVLNKVKKIIKLMNKYDIDNSGFNHEIYDSIDLDNKMIYYYVSSHDVNDSEYDPFCYSIGLDIINMTLKDIEKKYRQDKNDLNKVM